MNELKITIIRSRFGHLHIFKGDQKGKLTNLSSNVLLNGKESEIYVQTDTDIEGIEEFLTKEQKEDLNDGYEIVIDDFGLF